MLMTLTLEPKAPPLAIDETGTVRVGSTRVTIDTVIGSYLNGATAEQIALQFPALSLAHIYTVIAYYLNHQTEVDAYLHHRERQANDLRQRIEANSDLKGIRQRLMARRSAPGNP